MANFKRPTTTDLINNGKYPNAAVGTIIDTLGFTSKGDGGTAQWRKTGVTGLTASQTPAQLADAKLTDANGHEWELVRRGFNPLDQLGGMRGGVVDCTLPAQASLNAGILHLLDGSYLLSATIAGHVNGTSVLGQGVSSVLTKSSDFGEVLVFESLSPSTTSILDLTLKGFKINSTVEVNSGADLRITEAANFTLENISLQNGFIGLHLQGLRASFVDGIHIRTGALWSGVKAGSRFCLIEDSPRPAPVGENVETFFNNFDFTTNGGIYCEYGLEIQEADGVWFSNGHVLGASVANGYINGAATEQLLGLKYNNVWFDGQTTRSLIIDGSPSGFAGFYDFTGCTFTGASTYAVDIQAAHDDISFTGCKTWDIDSATTWNISAGSNIMISNNSIKRSNTSNAASAAAYRIGAGVENVSIDGGTIFDSPNLDFGIIDNGSSQLTVNGVAFKGFADSAKTVRVIDPSTTVYNSAGCTTDQTSQHVPGNSQRGEFLSVATDTARSFPIGEVLGGMLSVSVKFNSTYSGIVAFENSGAATTGLIAGAANIQVTTGPLTGTTGAPGVITVSVDSNGGDLYVENRTGVTRNIIWNIISRDFAY
jgi:hypothetical protein